MDDHGLIDLGLPGFQYTWSNKQGGPANIQERLDKGIANEEWKLYFLEAKITHLTALTSDHKPLLLQTNPHMDDLPKPFKFKSMWIGHPDTALIIEEAWNRHQPFLSRLKNTKMALKNWNKKVFGNVHAGIKEIREAIHQLQSQFQDRNPITAEAYLQKDLDEVLKREEALWQDKSKAKWIQERDVNT